MGRAGWGITALLLLVLTGCETGAQKELARMADAEKTTFANMRACTDRIVASDQWQALKDKLPPNGGASPSMALLTNKTKPTPQEATLLLSLHADFLVACRQESIADAGRVHPSFGAALAQNYAQADVAYAKLVQGQMSWGEFAQASVERRAAYRSASVEAESKIKQQLANAHAYEVQQRQAMASAVSQMMYQQQVISALNRPVNTTCTRNGQFLNCTSN